MLLELFIGFMNLKSVIQREVHMSLKSFLNQMRSKSINTVKSNRHNKWRGYAVGKHTPNQSLVLKIDKINQSTAAIFNHVLWDVLRLDLAASLNATSWLMRIEPEVQVLLFSRSNPYKEYRKLKKQAFEAIERRAGLSALACLTIIARKASVKRAIRNMHLKLDIGFVECYCFVERS